MQFFSGQAIAGNAVSEHTAQLFAGLENRGLVAHKGQVIGGGKAAGTAADNGDTLAGGGTALGRRHDSGMIHGIAFETTNIYSAFNHIAAAAGFAGMLADAAAGAGEWIILTDQPDRVGITARGHQGHIAGDIHTGGTLGHTGHRLIEIAGAAALGNMGNVVLPEAVQALEDHLCRFITDGTVSGIGDDLGRVFNGLQGVQGGAAVQHVLQKQFQLPQSYAAGDTFAAGLGVTEFQKRCGQIHGT